MAVATDAPREPRVERRLLAMGTWLDVAVAAPDARTAAAAAEAAVRALEAAEARLSTWQGGSELARLNAAPAGSAVPLSPALAADLQDARRCSELTSGAFDPAVGQLVAMWDLRGAGRVPAAEAIAAALPATGPAAWHLAGDAVTRLHPLATLDEGGFGKGAGLDDALAAARAAGATAAWLDLGGQTAQLGSRDWTVAIAAPDHRQEPVVELHLAGGSLSTSGNGERGLTADGVRIGHLLDPRTGAPAPDFGSLTVWADDALFADCLSTGLFVLGADAALAWASAHPEVGVLALERLPGGALRARSAGRLAGRVHVLDPAVELVPFPESPGGTAAGREKERSSGPAR